MKNYYFQIVDHEIPYMQLQQVQELLYTAAELRVKQSEGINEQFYYATIIIFVDNLPCGYCITYNNPHLLFEGKAAMALGNWECIDNDYIAKTLMDRALQLAADIHMQHVIGPMNGSTWDAHRYISDQGSEPLFLSETIQKKYYNRQWMAAGFLSIANYVSAIDTQMALYDTAYLEKYKLHLQQHQFTIRSIALDDFTNELKKMYVFCSKLFAQNYLYTPISEEQFIKKYTQIKPLLQSEYVLLAENNEGQIVSMLLAYADVLDPLQKRLIIKTIANSPGKSTAGATYIMVNQLLEQAHLDRITSVVHAFMHQQNVSASISKQYDGTIIRQYCLYQKSVSTVNESSK
jgi:hypothetical protein